MTKTYTFDFVTSWADFFTGLVPLREHLAGKHDQRAHGRRGDVGKVVGLQAAERGIMGKPIEHMVILDGQGRVVARAVGGGMEIGLGNDELRAIPGNIVTHNHPPHDAYGGRSGPPSGSDIVTAATHDAAEIRAVGSDGTVWSIKPGKDGWGDTKQIRSRLDANTLAVRQMYTNKARLGEIAWPDAAYNAVNDLVGLTAANMGWQYEVTHVDMG